MNPNTNNNDSNKNESDRMKVIMDHDGGIDDIVALAILAGYHELCDLIGVVCIDADCFIDPAVEVCGKVLAGMQVHGRLKHGADANPFEYLGKVPVGRSTLTAVHEFPREWRADAIKMNDLPCVNTTPILEQWEKNGKNEVRATEEGKFIAGEELLADLVMNKGSPADKVTICVTGPLSNVAYCVAKYGKRFTDNVEAVVIMGGAVDVHGNVAHSDAEWNIYWDAPSAKVVLECPELRNILFALDATNHVPVNSKFVQRFGRQKEGSFLSEFIGSSWATKTHSLIVYGAERAFAWDALAAAWMVGQHRICDDLERVPIRVVLADEDPKQEGRTMRLDANAAKAHGLEHTHCYLPTGVQAENFYVMMLELAARV